MWTEPIIPEPIDPEECRHKTLLLLPVPSNRLRCRHCHLTLKPDELRNSYCPECYEVDGAKRNDFEEVEEPAADKVQYRCEDCGILISVE
ncbi:hypothetical protein KFU94_49915 [Chloroflexi bacterium TSY]|nr:hypothetical protein [Chloroflexi bacterium TSY]